MPREQLKWSPFLVRRWTGQGEVVVVQVDRRDGAGHFPGVEVGEQVGGGGVGRRFVCGARCSTVTETVTVAPWPSVTVTVKVSVLAAGIGGGRGVRAAAVGRIRACPWHPRSRCRPWRSESPGRRERQCVFVFVAGDDRALYDSRGAAGTADDARAVGAMLSGDVHRDLVGDHHTASPIRNGHKERVGQGRLVGVDRRGGMSGGGGGGVGEGAVGVDDHAALGGVVGV